MGAATHHRPSRRRRFLRVVRAGACPFAPGKEVRGGRAGEGGSSPRRVMRPGLAGLYTDGDQDGPESLPGLDPYAAHFGAIRKVSHQMFDLCEGLTPVVQRNSIDEGYLDVGPCGFKIPSRLRRQSVNCRDASGTSCRSPSQWASPATSSWPRSHPKLRKPRGFCGRPARDGGCLSWAAAHR